MDLSVWFDRQLQASAEGFCWSVEQVPTERRFAQPPRPLGEWTVVRHVFHMLHYERTIALPSMRQWLGGPCPTVDDDDEDNAWDDNKDIDSLVAQFQAIRAEQTALLPQFEPALWENRRDAVWGSVTLRWVVSKTYQHTCDHTNNILQLALFWDVMARRQEREA